jgi:hypothetical protein
MPATDSPRTRAAKKEEKKQKKAEKKQKKASKKAVKKNKKGLLLIVTVVIVAFILLIMLLFCSPCYKSAKIKRKSVEQKSKERRGSQSGGMVLQKVEGNDVVEESISIAEKSFLPLILPKGSEPPGGWYGPFGFLRILAYIFIFIALLGVVLLVMAIMEESITSGLLCAFLVTVAVLTAMAFYAQEGLEKEIKKMAKENDQFIESNVNLEVGIRELRGVEHRMGEVSSTLEGSHAELEVVFQGIAKNLYLKQLMSVLSNFITSDSSSFGGDADQRLSSMQEVEGFVDSLQVLDTVPWLDKKAFSKALLDRRFGISDLNLLVDAMMANSVQETAAKLRILMGHAQVVAVYGHRHLVPEPAELVPEEDSEPPPLNPLFLVVHAIAMLNIVIAALVLYIPGDWINVVIAWPLVFCAVALSLNCTIIVSYLELMRETWRFRRNNEKLKENVARLEDGVGELKTAEKAFSEIDSKFGGSVTKAMYNLQQMQRANRNQLRGCARLLVHQYCDVDGDSKITNIDELDHALKTLRSVFGKVFEDFDERAAVIEEIVLVTLEPSNKPVRISQFSKLVEQVLSTDGADALNDLKKTLKQEWCS